MSLKSNSHFLVRTDATKEIGMGHLSRCLTLAMSLLNKNAQMTFVMREPSDVVREKVTNIGADLCALPLAVNYEEDLAQTVAALNNRKASGAILDGYQFDEAYCQGLADKTCLLLFDELAEHRINSALLLNQNIYADEMTYEVAPRTKLLLGARYAVLRDEFASSRPQKRSHPQVAAKLLITFGGSDPHGLTRRAFEELTSSRLRYEIKVVLGGGSGQLDQVSEMATQSRHTIEVLHDVTNMNELMNWADMALSASGTNTTLEMSCLGVPMVLIIQAENQRLIGEAMEAKGLAIQLGFWSELNQGAICQAVDQLALEQERRERMSAACMSQVDGKGADRVAHSLLATCGCA